MQLVKPLQALIISLLMFPLFACAEAGEPTQERYQAGQHYVVLPEPVRTRDSEKIEVVEVFWYGCSHCYTFEPLVKEWEKGLADDVDFWQSPAMWRDVMVNHARAFFAAQQLKKFDELHPAIFRAMNEDRNPLANEDAVAKLFARHGVNQEDFKNAFSSFAVTSGVRLADSRARSYRVTGTPEVIVNGKYRITGSMAGSQRDMLKVADFLVEKERKLKLTAQ